MPHFSRNELTERRRRLQALMDDIGIDGILLFRQESMYYLTGYETFGFCFFQCMYFGADGRLFLLTRSADLRQAQLTSTVEDIRVWVDGVEGGPAPQLRALLEEYGARGARLGVEYDSYGLTARRGRELDAALDGFCALEDSSELVDRLRMVKSSAELQFVRRAATLADDALDAGVALTRPGADEAAILAAMQAAVFAGGGDYPGNEFIIGSKERALLCRYASGRQRLEDSDQLTLEFAGVFRHYHAAMMRTVLLGEVHPEHRFMFDAARDAMAACNEALRPGGTAEDVFNAHARVLDDAGLGEHRLNACGYSLGARFSPSWMDYPMFHAGNRQLIEPGMVMFMHMILANSDSGRAMTLGETVIVREDGNERLSRHPLDLIVR
ncbi:MAG: aminopeptidase P family protein [Proteobacteria bacterium]|nr:MAG: aminopeptidase P family protein [Pseudomonadota bacterium]